MSENNFPTTRLLFLIIQAGLLIYKIVNPSFSWWFTFLPSIIATGLTIILLAVFFVLVKNFREEEEEIKVEDVN